MTAGRVQRYRTYLSKGLLAHKVLKILAGAGIVIEPYYFYREPAPGPPPTLPGAVPGEYEFLEAGPADTAGLAALDPGKDSRGEIENNFRNGRRCFALRHGGRIVAANWCDVREIGYEPCRRPLLPNEAYLCGMETLFQCRGRNLAPYLRSLTLRSLSDEGRDVVYSYSDRFNHSAVRFKRKMGARILFEGFYLKVPGFRGRNSVARRKGEPLGAPAD